MKFIDLARFLAELDGTRSRNAMTELLAVLMAKVEGKEIKEVCYLSLGGLGPAFDRVDFQLADKMVVKSLAIAFRVGANDVWTMYKKVGDLGTVASQFKTAAASNHWSVAEVYAGLLEIAKESGAGSQERKIQGLAKLLNQLDALSVKYVIRIVLGRLRLGFSDKTILDALSVFASGSKQGREEIESAYQVYPDIGEIANLVKEQGIAGINKKVSVTVGVPVVPALCQRVKTAKEMVEKMGEVLVEPKFDGTRVQIHIRRRVASDGEHAWQVKTFTRNLEETTWMFPELNQALAQVQAQEVVLDSEAVGFDPKTGKMLPFQETITRKRKHEIEAALGRVPLRFNVFDVLYCDSRQLINVPLRERRLKLGQIITEGKTLKLVEGIQTKDPQRILAYHKEKLNEGYEGVVLKQVEGTYEPGRRGFNWVKFKEVETTNGKLTDTIDAVVLGFYRGKGKRARFGLGAFLVGIQGEDNKMVTLAKIGTGLTDEQWLNLKKRLDEQVSVDKPAGYTVDKGLTPDVWVDPTVIVEIAADEITRSPIHSAGFALRFPRLIRFREDKSVGQITTLAELKQIRTAYLR